MSSNNSEVRFGVENLNVCSLEALSILDMKIFFYLTSFQAISLLKQQSSSDKKTDFLLPFWLTASNLCTEKQQEWWSICYTLLFKSKDKKHTEIDTKKQTNLAKILELVRLKSSVVKLTTDTKHVEKYKLNIKVCIKLVKYLQFLVENLSDKNKTDGLYGPFMAANSEIFYTPKEKLYYLKRYKFAYWNFVCRQIIKLRHLSLVNDQTLDSSQIVMANTSYANASALGTPERGVKLEDKTQSEIKNLFDFYEQLEELKPDLDWNKENLNTTRPKGLLDSGDEFNYDSIVLTGLLNLILNCVQCESESELDGNLSDDVEMVHGFHVTSMSNLNEAISLFDLTDYKCLDESHEAYEADNVYRFNFLQLQVNTI